MDSELFSLLKQDVRFVEGLKSCMNCGICTAICPAAEFYDYDPRNIVTTVQSQDNGKILNLLKSETIWYCGECLSCKTRCPRKNTPGYIIQALRNLSHKLGYFVESEKGRQSLAIKRTIGEEILRSGYCMYVDRISPEMHPEQGPVWEWIKENAEDVYSRCGANYKSTEGGAMRQLSSETLQELKSIFDETGGTAYFENIEKYSKQKAEELGIPFDETTNCEYFKHVYNSNEQDLNS